jgi:DNA-binding NarL/FixJ family response regulator
MGDVTQNREGRIRLLVADDHPITRNGIALILNGEPDMLVEAQASDGAEAITLYRVYRPDVAILDLQMPRVSGLTATVQILQEFPQANILVFTTYDGDEDIHRALHAGARGYVLKESTQAELILAVRTIVRGARYISPPVGARLAETSGQPALTDREREVLCLLAEGRSNKEISFRVGIAESTVKSHVATIIQKLGVTSRTEAALSALQRGFLRN